MTVETAKSKVCNALVDTFGGKSALQSFIQRVGKISE
jgi:hypothetical protein